MSRAIGVVDVRGERLPTHARPRAASSCLCLAFLAITGSPAAAPVSEPPPTETELRERLAACIKEHGANDPCVATIDRQLGEIYYDDKRYDEALPLYQAALEIRRRSLGEDDRYTATSYEDVAFTLHAMGRYAEAAPLFDQALAIRRRVQGEESEAAAISYDNVAINLVSLDRMADAAPLYAKALEIRRKVLGEDHADTAQSYMSVAEVLYALGRYSEIEPLFRKALDIRRRVLGEDNVDTALSYSALATDLNALGRYSEAEPLFRKSLDVRRRVLGEDHIDTMSSRSNLAANLNAQGRYAEAAQLFGETLETARRVLGEDHPATATLYNNLAANLAAMGRYADADPLYARSLDIRRRVLGEENADTAVSYNNVAYNLTAEGRYADATPLYMKALDIDRRVLGEDHPMTATNYDNLAANLYQLGRYAEAEPLFVKALDIRRRVLGDDHPMTALSYNNLAYDLATQGRFAEATPLITKALDICRRMLGENHPTTAVAYTNLAANLLTLGRFAEAAPLLKRALEIDRSVLGEERAETAAGYGTLGQALVLQGLYADAIGPYTRALEIDRRILGDGHSYTESAFADLAAAQLGVRGATEAALGNARAAVAVLRSRRTQTGRAQVGDDAQRLRESKTLWPHFVQLGDADWQRSQEVPAEQPTLSAEAFAALQDAGASSAGAAVAQMGARFSGGDPTLRDLARRRQDLAAQWAANDAEILRALASTDPMARERAKALRSEAVRLQGELERCDTELKAKFPAYFDLVSPEAVTVPALQSLLRDDEALLLVVPGLRGTHVYAVSRRRSHWVRAAWTLQQVAEAVRKLRCDTDPGHCHRPEPAPDAAPGARGAQRTDAPAGRKHSETASFDRAAAYALYQQVVQPVEDVLQGTRNVYVVTTGPLTSLPFSLLVTAPPAAGEDDADPEVLRHTPWLLRKFALTSLPSVASLKALRTFEQAAAAAPPSTGAFDFLGFGDPLFGGGTAVGRGATRAAELFGGLAANGAGLADPDALRRSFRELPGTKIELEGMQAAFAPRAQIRLGAEATESVVKMSRFAGVRVIAFSTHGLIAGEIDGIAEPGLVFTPPKTASAEDDGLLTASEVAQLRLGADWVILSACNTASSDGTPGSDALSGLARAFFYAGAKSLLVSHWPVRDDVASLLTVDAIQRERRDPALGRAGALRAATLAILDNAAVPSFAHPSAWAPFSLVGEGR